GFKVTPRVPGERGHAITQLDSFTREALGNLERTQPRLRIGRAVHRPLDRARDDLTRPVLNCGMVDDAVAEERPVLHQSEHGSFLPRLLDRRLPLRPKQGFTEWPEGRKSRADPGRLLVSLPAALAAVCLTGNPKPATAAPRQPS